MFIKEIYKEQKETLEEDDIKKIKIIRDALAHGGINMSEKGYTFISHTSSKAGITQSEQIKLSFENLTVLYIKDRKKLC